MYESICYQKDFLKEVICRVDFPSPIEELKTQLPPNIGKMAAAKFPISEQKTKIAQHIEFDQNGVKQATRTPFTEWHFRGINNEKRLVINPQTVFVSYSKYHAFEDLKDDLLSVLSELFKTYSDTESNRLGLRYVNVIRNDEAEEGGILDWKEYIDERLLALFNVYNEPDRIVRLFHIVELNFDNINLTIKYGLPNTEYPAIVKKREFTLDFDGYSLGLQDLEAVKKNIEDAHFRIQDEFERSITNKLKEVMRPVE